MIQVVKIGGNIVDNPEALDVFCQQFAKMEGPKLLVHGGGGVGAKMSPSAVLILNNGTSKLISVKDNSGVAKVLDLVPDFVNKFMDNGSVEKEENLDDIFEDKKEEESEEKEEENKE